MPPRSARRCSCRSTDGVVQFAAMLNAFRCAESRATRSWTEIRPRPREAIGLRTCRANVRTVRRRSCRRGRCRGQSRVVREHALHDRREARRRSQTARSRANRRSDGFEGENPATGVRWASVGFWSDGADRKWRFMTLAIAYNQSRPSELNYDTFLKELSRRLGKPKFHKNKIAVWNRGRDRRSY